MDDLRYEFAMRMIREAANIVSFRVWTEIPFQTKHGHQDIVSQFDQQIETFISDGIRRDFPLDGIIGEEVGAVSHGEWNWYIDPIDGTSNFVNQQKNYAISIACYHGDKPQFGLVLDVAANKLYHASAGQGAFCNDVRLPANPPRREISELFLYTPIIQMAFLSEHARREGLLRLANDVRAIRSLGSVALELCALAAREADIFLTARSSPWDHNAARIILAESGGAMRMWDGEAVPIERDCNVIAATSSELLETILQKYLTVKEK
ncbi:MAG: inositol monophosphatase [Clostridiales bacterium]|nr:inositol monophosphatase [Clostridiales bacterium]